MAAAISAASAVRLAASESACMQAGKRRRQRDGGIGADRDEGAVAEIEHVHQAEHQRQAGRDDEDDHAHGQAGEGQRHPGRERRRSAAAPRARRAGPAAPARHRGVAPAAGERRCGGRTSLVTGPSSGRAAGAAGRDPRPAPPSRRHARCGHCPSPRRCRRAIWRTGNSARRPGWWCRALFSSRNAAIMLAMMAGARPLVGSSIRNSLRGSMMARAIDSICFWPPDSTPAASDQNFSSAGNRPKIHAQPRRRRSARSAPPAADFRAPSGRRRCPCSPARRRCRPGRCRASPRR